jgi:hypothetical protein
MHGHCRHNLVLASAVLLSCGARSSLENRKRHEPNVVDGSTAPGEPTRPGGQLTPSNPPAAVPKPPAMSPPANVTPTVPPPPIPPNPVVVPAPTYDGWASCNAPLLLDFAAGSGGTYTSFSDDAVDTVASGCGVGGDVVFSWTAPSDGYFAFSTPNTEYDVTLALIANTPNCFPALACDRGLAGGQVAYLEQYASLGETFFVALEGSDAGRFSLSIEPIELPRQCAPQELPSDLTVAVKGDFVQEAQANAFGSYCNSGRRAVPFVYTAPCSGSYEVTAPGAAFDTVLIAAEDCEATAHECNDDFPAENGAAARLDLVLEAGQRVLLFLAADREAESQVGERGAQYVLQIDGPGCTP